MDNTESEVQASAFELDEMSELDAVDMFLSPSFEPESMAATSAVDDSANSETRHAEGLVETVMTGTDDAPGSVAATGVDNGSKKKKTRKNWPKPKSGDRLLYVMMDVEFSHPMKALGEIFEIGARPFRVDVVDEKSTTSIDLSAGVMMYKEQIEASLEYGAAEFYFMTIETTKTKRADLNGKRKFPEVFADMKKYIENQREKFKCTEVVCCGWNWYTTDHHWLHLMCHRHEIPWPDKWTWGWDPMRSIRAHNDNKYKVKTVKKGDDPQAALAGNRSMQLHDVYKAVTGNDMMGHHNADADVDAAIAIAVDGAVWTRRYKSLANHNGVYLLKERGEDIMKLFEKSKAEVTPPLPEGWIEDPPGEEAKSREHGGSESEEERQAARSKRIKLSPQVMPFPPISKTVADQLEHGWLRRARFEVPVDGSKENLIVESYLWKDSRVVGYVVAGDYLGSTEGITERRQKGKKRKKQVPSFLAQRMHAKMYGGVDRIGKGSKVYGINFNVVPWHKHLVTNTMNLNLHAMWTLAQYDMAVRKDYPLLNQFRASVSEKEEISTSRGITRARMFCPSLTRDVIERAVERIVKAGSFDPRPKKSGPAAAHAAGQSNRRGRPPKHNPRAELYKKSRRCAVCYARLAAINNQRPKDERYSLQEIEKGLLGKMHYTRYGCAVCNKAICKWCVATYDCDA